MENDQVKLLSDFRIQTDHHLDHNRPDSLACPFGICVAEKGRETIDQCQLLKVEVPKIWNGRSVSVIPIVIGL